MYRKHFLLFYYPNHVLLMSIMHSAIAIIVVYGGDPTRLCDAYAPLWVRAGLPYHLYQVV